MESELVMDNLYPDISNNKLHTTSVGVSPSSLSSCSSNLSTLSNLSNTRRKSFSLFAIIENLSVNKLHGHFDYSSDDSSDSSGSPGSVSTIPEEHLTTFPKYGNEISRMSSCRHSYSNNRLSLTSRRPSIIAQSDGIPIQYYRYGIYISVDTAVTTEKYTMYKVTYRTLKYNGVQEPAKNMLKRYSELRKFYLKLMKIYPNELADAPLLPKKEFFKRFDPDVIAHRVVQFNQLLKFIVLHPTLVQSEMVINFLEL
ncbi:hypothetical protein HDV06_001646 [Boothiomyces sp. JEL0866]|nr:hypothetical protein HDV06_001646 [Boothiomyces sp. JEL0866]